MTHSLYLFKDIFNTKCLYNSKAHASGCVINTCGWIRSKGYEVLLQIAHIQPPAFCFHWPWARAMHTVYFELQFSQDVTKNYTTSHRVPMCSWVVLVGTPRTQIQGVLSSTIKFLRSGAQKQAFLIKFGYF